MLRNSKKSKKINPNDFSTKFKKFYLTRREFSLSVHLSKVQKDLNDRLYYQQKDKPKAFGEENYTLKSYNYRNTLRNYQLLPDLSKNVNKIFDEKNYKSEVPKQNINLNLNLRKNMTK
jgi:hypothetical protein